jgi:hypothetical protein
MKWTKPQAEPLKLSSPDRQDCLNLFERLVMYSVDADEDYVDRIPTPLALHMLNLVRKRRGRLVLAAIRWVRDTKGSG